MIIIQCSLFVYLTLATALLKQSTQFSTGPRHNVVFYLLTAVKKHYQQYRDLKVAISEPEQCAVCYQTWLQQKYADLT